MRRMQIVGIAIFVFVGIAVQIGGRIATAKTIISLEPTPPEKTTAEGAEKLQSWQKWFAAPDETAHTEAILAINPDQETWRFTALSVEDQDKLTQALPGALASKSPKVRRKCVELMPMSIQAGEGLYVNMMLRALDDDAVEVRTAALSNLQLSLMFNSPGRKMGDKLWALAMNSRGQDDDYAALTVGVLGRYLEGLCGHGCMAPPPADPSGDDDDWLRFACFANSPVMKVRCEAFSTLSRSGFTPPELYETVLRGIGAADQTVRMHAYYYLRMWWSSQANPSSAAADAVWSHLRKELNDAEEKMPRDLLYSCAATVGGHDAEAKAFLLQGLHSTDSSAAQAAGESLAEIAADADTVRTVVSVMFHNDESYRNAAFHFLSSLPIEARTKGADLAVALSWSLNDSDLSRRVSAMKMIFESGLTTLHAAALAEAERVMLDKDVRERWGDDVLQSVTQFGYKHESGRALLRKYLYHRDPAIREQTVQNLAYAWFDPATALRRYGDDLAFVAAHDHYESLRQTARSVLQDWRTQVEEEFDPDLLP